MSCGVYKAGNPSRGGTNEVALVLDRAKDGHGKMLIDGCRVSSQPGIVGNVDQEMGTSLDQAARERRIGSFVADRGSKGSLGEGENR